MKKLITGLVSAALFFVSLTLPALSTAQDIPNPVDLTYVQGYPLDNFRVIATVNGSGNTCTGANCFTVYGQKSINNGNEVAAMLGIDNSQVSNLVYSFPANSPVVVARHNEYALETRIFVVKIISAADGSRQFLLSDYTPYHGERMVAAREYMTMAERQNPDALGNNPFFGNRGAAQDRLFHDCDFKCTQVAVGHAMRQYNASIGLVAKIKKIMDPPKTKKSGGLFKQTVTVTREGYIQPHWYVATSPEFQFQGSAGALTSWVCVRNEAPCAAEHTAYSGVAFVDWKGGSLSDIKELKYRDVEKKSGWTLFAMALFIGVLVAAAVFTGGASLSVALGAGFGTTIAYAGGYILLGGASLADYQSGLFGNTSKTVPLNKPTDKHDAKLREIIRPIVATNDIVQNGGESSQPICGVIDSRGSVNGCYNYSQGVSKVTQGTTAPKADQGCTLGYNSGGCLSADKGSLLRADDYSVYDASKRMGDEYNNLRGSNPHPTLAERTGWAREAAPDIRIYPGTEGQY